MFCHHVYAHPPTHTSLCAPTHPHQFMRTHPHKHVYAHPPTPVRNTRGFQAGGWHMPWCRMACRIVCYPYAAWRVNGCCSAYSLQACLHTLFAASSLRAAHSRAAHSLAAHSRSIAPRSISCAYLVSHSLSLAHTLYLLRTLSIYCTRTPICTYI